MKLDLNPDMNTFNDKKESSKKLTPYEIDRERGRNGEKIAMPAIGFVDFSGKRDPDEMYAEWYNKRAYESGRQDGQTYDGEGNLVDYDGMRKAQNGQVINQTLNELKMVGIGGLTMNEQMKGQRSFVDKTINGVEEDGLLTEPGFAYMTHIFRSRGVDKKRKEAKKKELGNGANVFTEAMEALKTAMKAIGIYSERNPNGLLLDLSEAEKIWFGDEEVDNMTKIQWRQTIEQGDPNIDMSKVRRFTNYDGSITWELLNNDKTISSRFTVGNHPSGMKVFAQGGYDKFLSSMEKLKEQIGSQGGFDDLRQKASAFTGR